jgi:protein-disulfide isomerase
MHKVFTLVASLAMTLCLAACQKTVAPVTDADMSLGNANAPVTVVEYASLACPVCAQWNNEVFQSFKAKYIDTGKVHYVLREALVHDPALAAAGFLTARCAGKDKYFKVVDDVFHAQTEMEEGGQPETVLQRIAHGAGLSDEQFDACIKDSKALAAVNARWDHYVQDDHINATPTFVINGKVYDGGYMPMSQLDDAINDAMARGKTGG